MDMFLTTLFNGLSVGSVYACLALALAITFKASANINFAQGQLALLSATFAYVGIQKGLNPILVWIVVSIGSFILSYFIHHLIVLPIAKQQVLPSLVLTLSLNLLLSGAFIYYYAADVYVFPSIFPVINLFESPYFNSHKVFVLIFSLSMMILISLFFAKTNLGLKMRAAVDQPYSAALIGINVKHTISLSWGISAMIGSLSGILLAPILVLDPFMMNEPMIMAITGLVLGGLNSIYGAALGGLILGMIESLITNIEIDNVSTIKTASALLVMALILIFKPNGLFGKSHVERV